jgi:hypothetical protein
MDILEFLGTMCNEYDLDWLLKLDEQKQQDLFFLFEEFENKINFHKGLNEMINKGSN